MRIGIKIFTNLLPELPLEDLWLRRRGRNVSVIIDDFADWQKQSGYIIAIRVVPQRVNDLCLLNKEIKVFFVKIAMFL